MSLPCDYARCAGYAHVQQCQTCARNWQHNEDAGCYRTVHVLPPEPEGECGHRIARETFAAAEEEG